MPPSNRSHSMSSRSSKSLPRR